MPSDSGREGSLYQDRASRSPVDGGVLVGRVLRDQGVSILFAISGGHSFPILANLRNNAVKLIHMRHEQACAYAADAYARSTGRVGVLSVGAGSGLTNCVTGLSAAAGSGSPLVCIAAQHSTADDGRRPFQESYGVEICRSFAKFSKRVVDWSTIDVDLRQAFGQAMAAPQGPAVVEIPANLLYHGDEPEKQQRAAGDYSASVSHSPVDAQQIKRILAMLAAAERPLIVAGDGVFWSDAVCELQAFVEISAIPVYSRRAGQGAVSEDHPLAIGGAWKRPFTGRADVVLAIGFKFWAGEDFGAPPTWNADAKLVRIDAVAGGNESVVAADMTLIGEPKLVLRQLIAAAKHEQFDFSRHQGSSWRDEVTQVRANFRSLIEARESSTRQQAPVHPDTLARTLCEVIDRDATVVLDSFTLSGWMTQWLFARFPGQIIDGGPFAPVGHGVGMAIGAQLARPGKQVVLVLGDGGLGIGGWDIETALRYELPIITVLWNNGSWGPSLELLPMLSGRTDPFNILEGIRYDRMFEILGCHTEHVDHPAAFRPALERALHSGKASLINVVGDKRIGHPRLSATLLPAVYD